MTNAWIQRNPEKRPAMRRREYAKNREKIKERARSYYNRNREKCLQSSKEYQRKHRDRLLAQHHKQYLKRKYGITKEEILAMINAQENHCMMCNELFLPGKRIVVDHDHVTGQVRSVLHHRCNITLGFIENNPRLTKLALAYLERHG